MYNVMSANVFDRVQTHHKHARCDDNERHEQVSAQVQVLLPECKRNATRECLQIVLALITLANTAPRANHLHDGQCMCEIGEEERNLRVDERRCGRNRLFDDR